MICGDFNTRIGGLNDNVGGIALPQREILDTVTNSHGRQLVDFLRDCDMVTLNRRFHRRWIISRSSPPLEDRL